jgi:hypothetical protein
MAWTFVAPETQRITFPDGEWVTVKKRLNAGEQRRIFKRMVKGMRPGEKVELEPEQIGRSKVVEYLLDWSAPIAIQGKSPDEIGQILDGLDPDDYARIVKAVDAHETAEDERLEQEKNATAGLSASTPI